MKNLRDYGLGNYTQFIVGRPHLAHIITDNLGGIPPECPNCKMDRLCEVEVILRDMPLLKSTFALGRYLSCPACPWASPMVAGPIEKLPEWWRE